MIYKMFILAAPVELRLWIVLPFSQRPLFVPIGLNSFVTIARILHSAMCGFPYRVTTYSIISVLANEVK